MPSDFNDKNVIVITGAANGISSQIALDLDKSENILCLFDKDSRLKEIADAITKAQIFCKIGDVSLENEVNDFINEVVLKFDKVDALVNGAGVVPYEHIDNTSYEVFKKTLEVNLGGYFLFSKAVSFVMKKKRRGIIINIASTSAELGIVGQAAYASSKGGIVALTHVLAVELGPFGIRVNAIAPGSIVVERNKIAMMKKLDDTNDLQRHVPLGRLGTPADVSGVVQFLLSDLSAYVHGVTIVVDGGRIIKGA